MPIMPQLKKFLLGQLLRLEKPVYSLDYWLITMESNQQPDEEINTGEVLNKDASVLVWGLA